MSKRSEARRQFLWDVFVTAIEGGINYWSRATEYHIWLNPTAPSGELIEDLDGFYAMILDSEGGNVLAPPGETGEMRIDRDVITRGIGRIMRARAPYYDPNDQHTQCEQVKYLWKSVADIVRNASHSNDGGEIDAGVADNIVQVGLFGEVVYG